MRIAALILGVVGGILGIVAGIFAMTVGGLGTALEAEGAGTVTGLGFAALLLGVVGIAGGGLALRYPRAGAVLQLVAGLGDSSRCLPSGSWRVPACWPGRCSPSSGGARPAPPRRPEAYGG